MDRKTKDKYLQKKYGRGIEWFEERSKNGCEVCGSFGKTRSLSLDHSHKVRLKKITSWRSVSAMKGWFATAWSYISASHGMTKSEAIRKEREKLKAASARGVLCVWCNTGLKKFRDNPVFLRKAAEYLERYEKELSVK